MNDFARLFERLDQTTRTNEKIAAMRDYFAGASDEDGAWAVYLLTGNRLGRAVPTPVMGEALLEATALPAWLINESYDATGDWSEAASLMTAGRERRDGITSDDVPASLNETMHCRIMPVLEAPREAQKALLQAAWRELDVTQRFLFNKMLRGGFRVGVQKKLVVRALAEVAGVTGQVMAHRLSGQFKPTAEAYRALVSADAASDVAARPYPFFLAHQLDGPPESLGDIGDWILEWKWDGVRAQVIKRDGRVGVWSRGEELVTHSFPEVEGVGAALPNGTVLDGEILLWKGDAATGQPRSFNDLQKRLNRKVAPTLQMSLFETDRLVFVGFDALEVDGRDLRGEPLRERRAILERLAAQVASPHFFPSRVLSPESWADAAAIRAGARELGAEGVMIKHASSLYGVGRQKPIDGGGGWWKWKLDPYTIDAVLVYSQPGSGKRAGLFTDHTFGLWDERDGARKLRPFAKAYSGLTHEEIEEVDKFIRAHTTSKSGPVRVVEPRLVFELGFEGIQESGRNGSGLAVRFPRILRWRRDKPAAEADSLGTLRAMFDASRKGI